MGASTFMSSGKGKSAQEVFTRLTEESRYEFGRSYSGEIGMKRDFEMVTVPSGMDPVDFASACLEDDSHFCYDK